MIRQEALRLWLFTHTCEAFRAFGSLGVRQNSQWLELPLDAIPIMDLDWIPHTKYTNFRIFNLQNNSH